MVGQSMHMTMLNSPSMEPTTSSTTQLQNLVVQSSQTMSYLPLKEATTSSATWHTIQVVVQSMQ